MKNIPVVHVCETSLAAAYEKALIALYAGGVGFQTQYDKPGDPLSLDCTLNLTVLEPLSEPMIHKAFPGGIEDLREYVMEVGGAKDHWVKNMNDPQDTRWEYTYHGRLARYGTWQEQQAGKSVRVGPFKYRHSAVIYRQDFEAKERMVTFIVDPPKPGAKPRVEDSEPEPER